jgi:hypothetical protein
MNQSSFNRHFSDDFKKKKVRELERNITHPFPIFVKPIM